MYHIWIPCRSTPEDDIYVEAVQACLIQDDIKVLLPQAEARRPCLVQDDTSHAEAVQAYLIQDDITPADGEEELPGQPHPLI
jgi:hypothetical protein